MDTSLDMIDAVAKRCGKQLEEYQKCLLSTGNDLSACESQRQSLTNCAGEAVPIMGKIRQSCARHIAAFNSCLEENKGKSDKEAEVKCTPALRQMLDCSNSVRRAEGLEEVGLAKQ